MIRQLVAACAAVALTAAIATAVGVKYESDASARRAVAADVVPACAPLVASGAGR